MHKKIKGLLDLCRVSNLPTVLSNCIGSWFLAGGAVGELNLLLLVSGSALLYSGGMIMNDVLDVAYDSKFRPERPIPFGTISKRTAGIITLLFIIAGMALMIVGNSHLFSVLSLIAVIIAYNISHKKWSHSVYLMGACRSILYLACASAVTEQITPNVVAWSISLGLYTAGITIVARGESTDSSFKLSGLVLLFSPILVPVYLKFNDLHLVGTFVSGALWLAWTVYSLRILKGGSEGRVGRAVSYLIAGMVLIDGFAISSHFGWSGLFFLPLLPLIIWFQTKVSGT